MNTKYHVYLNYEERRLVIKSLNDLRNRLISEGKYTDLIDEVLVKVANAKIKKMKVVSKKLVNGIFADFEVGNDDNLTH